VDIWFKPTFRFGYFGGQKIRFWQMNRSVGRKIKNRLIRFRFFSVRFSVYTELHRSLMDEKKNSIAGSKGGWRCLRRRCRHHSSAPPLPLARAAAPHAWPLALLRAMAAQAAFGAAYDSCYCATPRGGHSV
jgi:hypothetical protein